MSKRRKTTGKARREAQQRAGRNRKILAGLFALVLVTAVIFVTWQQAGGGSALPADQIADPALGPETAPVTIVEYADFGCPACRAWHNAGIRQQVMDDFEGQVRFVWKDFPVITVQSPKAAQAGHCAAAQGQFWAYHDYLYERPGNLAEDGLKQAAFAVGLERAAFDRCLDDGQMARKVQRNEQEARRLGFRGTPGFTVNGKALAAPPSYDQLATLIQQALAQ